ncbi:MAG: DUF3373 family protein [Desulfobacterales bacterium]
MRCQFQLSVQGRLAAYKAFGDGTGVKIQPGQLGDVTDSNTSSLPHGDTIHGTGVFCLQQRVWPSSSRRPFRRPSPIHGWPALEYRNNSLVGGSPMATIINWQFDGASLTFGLEELTGIPGACSSSATVSGF